MPEILIIQWIQCHENSLVQMQITTQAGGTCKRSHVPIYMHDFFFWSQAYVCYLVENKAGRWQKDLRLNTQLGNTQILESSKRRQLLLFSLLGKVHWKL